MFKVGEFARLSQVSVKTLHHYDEIGLFTPTWTDPHTGYRYYSMEQLPQLKHIVMLKDLGLSLDEICHVLHRDPAQVRAVLQRKQLELLTRIREDQRRLAQIDAQLAGHCERTPSDRLLVQVAPLAELLVASIRARIPHTALPALHGELHAHLHQHQLATTQQITLFYLDDSGEAWQEVEVAVPIPQAVPVTDRVQVRALPAIPETAQLCHHGSPHTLHRSYELLGQWIEAHGFRSGTPWYEIAHASALADTPTIEPRIELCIPIQAW